MTYSRLADMELKDKNVLVRVDFNVPLHDGKITDDTKIKAALPTIKYILKQKPKQIILMSHLGRPGGQVKEELSLEPIAMWLSEKLDQSVFFKKNCKPEMPDNQIVLLENLRFNAEEKANDARFAKKIAKCADVYVNDAFGTAHRAHASNNAITKFLPSCAGLLLQNEIEHLSKALEPEKPLVAILGGAKLDKLHVIENLVHKADKVLMGGVLANTFLMAEGKDIGISVFDHNSTDYARELYEKEVDHIVLPIDALCGKKFSADAKAKKYDADAIPSDCLIMDIGPKTITKFKKEIAKAKTIVWMGPIGVFEFDEFSKGTQEIAKAVAESGAISIIGGGESAASVAKFGYAKKMTHVSTGGGASLEFLGGKKLPAIEAMEESYNKHN